MADIPTIDCAAFSLIGRGATAEVFRAEGDRALKLFYPRMSKAAVEYEAAIAAAVDALDLPAPRFYGLARADDSAGERFGILYEYAGGNSLLEELLQNRKNRKALIDEFARTHLTLTEKNGKGLPAERERFAECLSRTDLGGPRKEAVLALLDTLPKGHAVCHGDFHPGNVHRGPQGLIVLDWMNAYAGNPVGDAVRSIMMLESPFLSFPMNAFRRFGFALLKYRLARRYRRTIERAMPLANYRAWRAVIAAVRLSDGIPEEVKWLNKIIDRGLRHAGIRV